MAKTQTQCIQVRVAETRDTMLSSDPNGRFPNQVYFVHQDRTNNDDIVITVSVFVGIANNAVLPVDPVTRQSMILTVVPGTPANASGGWQTRAPKGSKRKRNIIAAGGIIIDN